MQFIEYIRGHRLDVPNYDVFLSLEIASTSSGDPDEMLQNLPWSSLVASIVPVCFVAVNSYGHYRTVSSPNHTFTWASLNKRLTSTSCTYSRL